MHDEFKSNTIHYSAILRYNQRPDPKTENSRSILADTFQTACSQCNELSALKINIKHIIHNIDYHLPLFLINLQGQDSFPHQAHTYILYRYSISVILMNYHSGRGEGSRHRVGQPCRWKEREVSEL